MCTQSHIRTSTHFNPRPLITLFAFHLERQTARGCGAFPRRPAFRSVGSRASRLFVFVITFVLCEFVQYCEQTQLRKCSTAFVWVRPTYFWKVIPPHLLLSTDNHKLSHAGFPVFGVNDACWQTSSPRPLCVLSLQGDRCLLDAAATVTPVCWVSKWVVKCMGVRKSRCLFWQRVKSCQRSGSTAQSHQTNLRRWASDPSQWKRFLWAKRANGEPVSVGCFFKKKKLKQNKPVCPNVFYLWHLQQTRGYSTHFQLIGGTAASWLLWSFLLLAVALLKSHRPARANILRPEGRPLCQAWLGGFLLNYFSKRENPASPTTFH